MKGERVLRQVAHWIATGLLVARPAAWGETPAVSAPKVEPAAPGACILDRRLEELWPPLGEVAFQPTTLEDRTAFSQLIPTLLEAAPQGKVPPPSMVELARSIGFRLDTWDGQHGTLWVLREQPGQYRGAGAYVIRTGQATEDVVQAPHAYFDKGTGPLGAALFSCAPAGRRPRAFATNTAHRYRGRKGEKVEDAGHPADVAHAPDHLFQWVTDLMARSLPRLRVIQLHGFDNTALAARTELVAVVSSGSRTACAWSRQVSLRLAVMWGAGVRLFPEQTTLLGGTRNAQARLLQNHPSARFLHLELSAQVREALAAPALRTRLAYILFAVEED